MSNTPSGESPNERLLGLATSEIANVSVDELRNNVTAIKMVLHYYQQLVDDNRALKNSNNTLKTYVDAYDKNKSSAATGAVLLVLSNIVIAIGVNLVTGADSGHRSGAITLVAGVVIAVVGVYFSFKDRAR